MLLAKKLAFYIKILLAYDATICIELMYNMYHDNLTVAAIINSYFQYIGFNIVFLRGIIFGVHVYIYALMFDEIHGHAEQFFLPYRKLSPEFLKEYPIFDFLNKETMAENAVYQDSSRSRTPSLRKIKVTPMSKYCVAEPLLTSFMLMYIVHAHAYTLVIKIKVQLHGIFFR